MARGPALKIILTDSERSELEMRVRRRKIARAAAIRAKIVLLAADGMNDCAIADEPNPTMIRSPMRRLNQRTSSFATADLSRRARFCLRYLRRYREPHTEASVG